MNLLGRPDVVGRALVESEPWPMRDLEGGITEARMEEEVGIVDARGGKGWRADGFMLDGREEVGRGRVEVRVEEGMVEAMEGRRGAHFGQQSLVSLSIAGSGVGLTLVMVWRRGCLIPVSSVVPVVGCGLRDMDCNLLSSPEVLLSILLVMTAVRAVSRVERRREEREERRVESRSTRIHSAFGSV
jgi:hypothetical protein